MDQYIVNLVDNHPVTTNCFDMDIVLESGCANGSFHIGCLLYISLLERKNIVKVKRISGSSVGAIAGFYYILNALTDFKNDYKKIRACFKKKLNYSILKTILEKKIETFTNETLENFNNKLFIVFHDIEEKKQIVKNTFSSKEDLLSALLKSCHIPYLANDKFFYIENNKKYFDGGIPYIFPERGSEDNKILYINISRMNKLNKLFCTNKERNNYGRLLEGALDAHEFFLYKRRSKFCSYVNEWKILDFALLRLKQLIFKLIFYFLLMLYFLGKKIMPFISEYYFVQTLLPVFIHLYRDILLFYCL